MNRREVLKAAAALPSAAALNCLPISLASVAAAPQSVIDAHCHVFNAHDLPLVEFVEKVILAQQSKYEKYGTKYGNAVHFFLRFAAQWMRESEKANEDKHTALNEVAFLNDVAAGKKQARSLEQIRSADIEAIAVLVDELKTLRVKNRNFKLAERLIAPYLPGIVVGLMHREAYPIQFPAKGMSNTDGAFTPDNWIQNSLDLATALYFDGKGDVSHLIRWAAKFRHYRHELADELQRIHGNRLVLATPALIDYTHWLNDRFDVNLANQVAVMGAITSRKGGVPIHGFAPFDPLRHARQAAGNTGGDLPFDIVKRAVSEHGFIGVKLYPPMGFLPLDNKKNLRSASFPQHLKAFRNGLGGKLDKILADLYSWCLEEHVCILAHAANSNGAGRGYSERANPDNWAVVAERYPGIRLSLAHFGDFDAGFDAPGNRRPKLNTTWEWKMAEVATRYSNVFLDMSYMERSLLERENNIRIEIKRMLRELRREFAVLDDRLLFGTDWSMFGREPAFGPLSNAGQFINRISEVLSDANFTDEAIQKIMFTNAVRFLGLDRPDDQKGNRARLNTFYQKTGVPNTWLDNIPVAS